MVLPATRNTILIECATDTCQNALALAYDSAWPKGWLCPACEDHLHEQHMEAMSQRENAPGLDRPIKRFADF